MSRNRSYTRGANRPNRGSGRCDAKLATSEIMRINPDTKRDRRVRFGQARLIERARAGDKNARATLSKTAQALYLHNKKRSERDGIIQYGKIEGQGKGIIYNGLLLPINKTQLSTLISFRIAKADLGLLSSSKRGILEKLINEDKAWVIDLFAPWGEKDFSADAESRA